MTPSFESELQKAIEGEVRFDQVTRALYATDASVYQIMPKAVVVPKTVDDVEETLRTCRHYHVPITARGGGTSQAGQAIGAGVQLDFSKHLNRILEIDPERKRVRVQPGIVLDELNAQLKIYNLQLPLDLSTSNRATIGGMIANNSAGTRSVTYGKTLDYVESMRVLLANGEQVALERQDLKQWQALCRDGSTLGKFCQTVEQLTTEHAAEIEARFPKIMRRVGGYNLDRFVPERNERNLCDLLVGSEGTLGLTLDATLRLVEPPKARAVCVVHFNGLLDALAAVPSILEEKPSAVELVDDFILDSTRGKTAFEPLRDFIQGDPQAILVVEFFGSDTADAEQRVQQLEERLRGQETGYHIHRAFSAKEQGRIWQLRRAALGLSMSARGDDKAISFVEDSAVDPIHLRDYIERFLQVLERHDTKAGFYAHASVGLLHIRPVVNLKSSVGVARFEAIASEVADLALEFGGAISGEHGDGLVRAPFQERMFGKTLYGVFQQIKRTFDPEGILNPGKIVDAPELTTNLRFGREEFATPQVPTMLDFEDFGGLSRAAEQCGGVGACRKTLSGTMCPSYMATQNEVDSTRGRANALRMAIHGELDLAWHDPELMAVMELCLECKACKTECPTGVDMARMKSELLYQHHQSHGVGRRTKWLANVRTLARWGSRFAPISNWIAASSPSRWLQDRFMGIDPRRSVPSFAKRSLRSWWHRNVPVVTDPSVVLFADTFTTFHEPSHGIAFAEIVDTLPNDATVLGPDVCCGRPLISKGLLQEARSHALSTIDAMLPHVEKGRSIAFVEPGCYSAVADDFLQLVPRERRKDAQRVAEACVSAEEWLADRRDQLRDMPSSTEFKLAVHGHCHYKSLLGMEPTTKLLSSLPNVDFEVIDSGCCGMAGSFGYEREHYDVSKQIGEQRLFPAVANAKDATVAAHGFSCRHQISHFTGIQPISVVEAVRDAVLISE